MSTVVDGRPLTVYEPQRRSLPKIRPYLRDLWARREFIVHLARTDLVSDNYNTVLGQAWIILNPLLMACIYYVLVGILRGSERGRADFFSLLLAGLFLFTYMRNSLRGGATSIIGGGKLLLNSSVPRALMPLTAVVNAFMQFLPTVPVFLVIHAALGQPFRISMVSLLPIAAILTLFNIGVALFMAAATVYFRDARNFVQYLLRIWLYLCPILWLVEDLDGSRFQEWGWLLRFNPLFPHFAGLQGALQGVWPSAIDWLWMLGVAVATLVVGGLFFLSKEREFAVRI